MAHFGKNTGHSHIPRLPSSFPLVAVMYEMGSLGGGSLGMRLGYVHIDSHLQYISSDNKKWYLMGVYIYNVCMKVYTQNCI